MLYNSFQEILKQANLDELINMVTNKMISLKICMWRFVWGFVYLSYFDDNKILSATLKNIVAANPMKMFFSIFRNLKVYRVSYENAGLAIQSETRKK